MTQQKEIQTMQNNNNWINHPNMNHLDPVKLELIRNAALQVNGKSGSAMATTMMTLITAANKKGVQFAPDEISLILDILKDGKSDQEKQQIDHVVKMLTNYMKKGH